MFPINTFIFDILLILTCIKNAFLQSTTSFHLNTNTHLIVYISNDDIISMNNNNNKIQITTPKDITHLYETVHKTHIEIPLSNTNRNDTVNVYDYVPSYLNAEIHFSYINVSISPYTKLTSNDTLIVFNNIKSIIDIGIDNGCNIANATGSLKLVNQLLNDIENKDLYEEQFHLFKFELIDKSTKEIVKPDNNDMYIVNDNTFYLLQIYYNDTIIYQQDNYFMLVDKEHINNDNNSIQTRSYFISNINTKDKHIVTSIQCDDNKFLIYLQRENDDDENHFIILKCSRHSGECFFTNEDVHNNYGKYTLNVINDRGILSSNEQIEYLLYKKLNEVEFVITMPRINYGNDSGKVKISLVNKDEYDLRRVKVNFYKGSGDVIESDDVVVSEVNEDLLVFEFKNNDNVYLYSIKDVFNEEEIVFDKFKYVMYNENVFADINPRNLFFESDKDINENDNSRIKLTFYNKYDMKIFLPYIVVLDQNSNQIKYDIEYINKDDEYDTNNDFVSVYLLLNLNEISIPNVLSFILRLNNDENRSIVLNDNVNILSYNINIDYLKCIESPLNNEIIITINTNLNDLVFTSSLFGKYISNSFSLENETTTYIITYPLNYSIDEGEYPLIINETYITSLCFFTKKKAIILDYNTLYSNRMNQYITFIFDESVSFLERKMKSIVLKKKNEEVYYYSKSCILQNDKKGLLCIFDIIENNNENNLFEMYYEAKDCGNEMKKIIIDNEIQIKDNSELIDINKIHQSNYSTNDSDVIVNITLSNYKNNTNSTLNQIKAVTIINTNNYSNIYSFQCNNDISNNIISLTIPKQFAIEGSFYINLNNNSIPTNSLFNIHFYSHPLRFRKNNTNTTSIYLFKTQKTLLLFNLCFTQPIISLNKISNITITPYINIDYFLLEHNNKCLLFQIVDPLTSKIGAYTLLINDITSSLLKVSLFIIDRMTITTPPYLILGDDLINKLYVIFNISSSNKIFTKITTSNDNQLEFKFKHNVCIHGQSCRLVQLQNKPFINFDYIETKLLFYYGISNSSYIETNTFTLINSNSFPSEITNINNNTNTLFYNPREDSFIIHFNGKVYPSYITNNYIAIVEPLALINEFVIEHYSSFSNSIIVFYKGNERLFNQTIKFKIFDNYFEFTLINPKCFHENIFSYFDTSYDNYGCRTCSQINPNTPYLLFIPSFGPSIYDKTHCVSKCPPRTFLYKQKCVPSCRHLGLYEYDNKCVSQCPNGYGRINQFSYKCIPCNSEHNQIAYDDMCMLKCPNKTLLNEDKNACVFPGIRGNVFDILFDFDDEDDLCKEYCVGEVKSCFIRGGNINCICKKGFYGMFCDIEEMEVNDYVSNAFKKELYDDNEYSYIDITSSVVVQIIQDISELFEEYPHVQINNLTMDMQVNFFNATYRTLRNHLYNGHPNIIHLINLVMQMLPNIINSDKVNNNQKHFYIELYYKLISSIHSLNELMTMDVDYQDRKNYFDIKTSYPTRHISYIRYKMDSDFPKFTPFPYISVNNPCQNCILVSSIISHDINSIRTNLNASRALYQTTNINDTIYTNDNEQWSYNEQYQTLYPKSSSIHYTIYNLSTDNNIITNELEENTTIVDLLLPLWDLHETIDIGKVLFYYTYNIDLYNPHDLAFDDPCYVNWMLPFDLPQTYRMLMLYENQIFMYQKENNKCIYQGIDIKKKAMILKCIGNEIGIDLYPFMKQEQSEPYKVVALQCLGKNLYLFANIAVYVFILMYGVVFALSIYLYINERNEIKLKRINNVIDNQDVIINDNESIKSKDKSVGYKSVLDNSKRSIVELNKGIFNNKGLFDNEKRPNTAIMGDGSNNNSFNFDMSGMIDNDSNLQEPSKTVFNDSTFPKLNQKKPQTNKDKENDNVSNNNKKDEINQEQVHIEISDKNEEIKSEPKNAQKAFCKIIGNNFRTLHPIVSLVFGIQICGTPPPSLKIWFFIFNIISLFSFNAIYYTETQILAKVVQMHRYNFVYVFVYEIGKIFASIATTKLFMVGFRAICFVTYKMKQKYKDTSHVLDSNMLWRRIIACGLMFILEIFFTVYCIGFCGVYIRTQISWFFAGVWACFIDWILLSTLFVLIITFIEVKCDCENGIHIMKQLFMF